MANKTDSGGSKTKNTIGGRPNGQGKPATQAQTGAPKVQAKPIAVQRPAPIERGQPPANPLDWLKQQAQAVSDWAWRNNPNAANPNIPANQSQITQPQWAKTLTGLAKVALPSWSFNPTPGFVPPAGFKVNPFTGNPSPGDILQQTANQQRANDAWAARYTGQAAAYYKEQERQARANQAYTDRLTGQAAEYYSRPIATLPGLPEEQSSGYSSYSGSGGYGYGGYGRDYSGSGYNNWAPSDPVKTWYNQLVQWSIGTPKGG